MTNAILFIATVLIWGTTWIGIAFQVESALVMVSVFYRFGLGALLMLAGLAIIGRLRRPSIWRFVVVQAMCLFCFNFIGLYHATVLIPSGLVSVIFSLASIFNAVKGIIPPAERGANGYREYPRIWSRGCALSGRHRGWVSH